MGFGCFLASFTLLVAVNGLPSLRDSIRQPLQVVEGEDALLTCVVRNLDTNTLLWKREDRTSGVSRVLTAGENRVTSDPRFDVLHDSAPFPPSVVTSGGDVWVLVLKKVRPSDAGTYVCEINSNPILRSFHTLIVTPNGKTNGTDDDADAIESLSVLVNNHNYTDCCRASNVSNACLGFCTLRNILDGTTNQDPEKCEDEFPAIVKCMADGRNHVPCCVEEGVPDVCQDICRGEYTIPTDDIKTHISCAAYTERTLACIAEGIGILPKAPETVLVEPISESSLAISWSKPTENFNNITFFYVNITTLATFDPTDDSDSENEKSNVKPFLMQLKVPPNSNSTTVDNLSPFTMYEISVTSFNMHGTSLPSVRVRSLTKSTKASTTPGKAAPALPDIKGCCNSKGVYHSRCVEKFCDPVRTADVSLPDLMICAPWASDSFSCLANGIDHTDCCQARGLPPPCVQLCSGNISRVDYNQFRCIQYMDDLSNCLLQGYGVLPSAPVAFRVSNINPTFAILRWDVPKQLGKTVVSYNVYYREMTVGSKGPTYRLVNTKNVPFILEFLKSNTDYEVYVSAVNEHGIGEQSARIIFKTLEEKTEETSSLAAYNVTTCCHAVAVSAECMPLCDYSAKLSDLQKLTSKCSRDFPKLLRCGAGGRNHAKCCERRGIPQTCLSFCTGHVTEEMVVTAAACLPYVGNVIQCFEEGTGLIPGPIIQLKASFITDTSVTLQWQPPEEGTIDYYIVHYMAVEEQASKASSSLELDHQFNVSETRAVIKELKTNQLYNLFVVAANEHGTSLPSSIITVNITKEGLANGSVSGVPSPPQGVSVTGRSADYITVSWQPPAVIHPTDKISYNFYSRKRDEKTFKMIHTTSTFYRLDKLAASSQHIIYVTATNDNGESRPSETLMAWTDPAFEPLVELPTIHPASTILEGGSVTVICVAMGTPMPLVSLLIDGTLIKQEKTRHLVTSVSNVTRSMTTVTCYADNGYGQPSEASKRIYIGRRPSIHASMITLATPGEEVTLECQVDAHPTPVLGFSRDQDLVQSITNSSKYEVTVLRESQEVDAMYVMKMKVKDVTNDDSGVYYCNAQNTFGSFAQVVKLQTRQKIAPSVLDVRKCCEQQNVTAGCMDACTLFLDMDSVIDRPECINDFHKLMRCAADGSDHRGCCTQWGVPRRCLDWCRGEPVASVELCALAFTKPIVACFHEGKERIPGPPKNLRIQLQSENAVKVSWDPPSKNPDKIELYRVFWRVKGSKQSDKNDTKTTSLVIAGLKENAAYELVVKAGNRDGTSALTEPLAFTLSDRYVFSSTTGDASVGVIVGVVMAVVLIIGAGVGMYFYFRNHHLLGLKLSGFDKPVFGRNKANKANDTLQIIANEVTSESSVDPRTQAATWKQEDVQQASGTEAPPTIREELRLGAEGAGFKRFK